VYVNKTVLYVQCKNYHKEQENDYNSIVRPLVFIVSWSTSQVVNIASRLCRRIFTCRKCERSSRNI